MGRRRRPSRSNNRPGHSTVPAPAQAAADALSQTGSAGPAATAVAVGQFAKKKGRRAGPLPDPFARGPKIRSRRNLAGPEIFARPACRAQRFRPAPPKMPTPFVQLPRRDPKLPGESSRPLARDHPLQTSSSPLENCPLFWCLILGGTPPSPPCFLPVI